MTVATYAATNNTTQSGAQYLANLDGDLSVHQTLAGMYAPHAAATPNMTVQVDAGNIMDTGLLVSNAQQTTGTITAPVSNPRIDRVVADQRTGVISVVTGTPAGSPTAPAIPAGKFPICQVLLQTSTTAITNSMITDERCLQTTSNAYEGATYAPLASPAMTGTPTAPTASVGTNTTQLATTAFVLTNSVSPRGYLSGCTLSTAGASSTMSVAAGQAVDSTSAVAMTLAATSKTTSAWASGSGNGGIDTGAIAASTWYYWYVIFNPTTLAVDVIFSLSSSAPTLPSGYTKYRYIGAGLTDASSHWTAFTQMGREFYWSTPVQDFNGAGATTASLLTCSAPRGRKVKITFNINFSSAASGTDGTYISDPANADLAPSATASPAYIGSFSTGSSYAHAHQASVWSNTSAQIRHRELSTSNLMFDTLGWVDLADSQ